MKFTPHQAFTIDYNRLANIIKTRVAAIHVNEIDETKIAQTVAIWDTGATSCTITQSFASKIILFPTSKTIVKGVHGEKEVNVYLIDLFLPNNVKFNGTRVTEGAELSADGNCAMFIGMDIRVHADIAISNKDEKTVFSFRIPSQEKIDFIKAARIQQAKQQKTANRKNPKPKRKKRGK